MIGIGIVGIGFMGHMHFLAAQKLRAAGRAAVTAICSRDPLKLAGDWRSIRGNYGPPGSVVDLAGVSPHREISSLLADPNVQLVDICLPTDRHAEVAIAALRAGKHVLVEKPIALTTAEAQAMLSAARAANRRLMVAHVLPFFPEWDWVLRTVRSGQYGRLLAAHFRRVISQPDWSADIADAAKTGGPAIDLHIHDTHFVQLLAGRPSGVFARGVFAAGTCTHLETTYLYDGPADSGSPSPSPTGPAVTASSGALSMKGRPFAHSYELFLERATLVLEAGASGPTLLTADGASSSPPLADGDPVACFEREIAAAVAAVADPHAALEPALSAEGAALALELCLQEVESARQGRARAV